MADARGELGDEGEVALLAGRNGVRPPVESTHQRLVVCKDHEIASLQHVTEVANRCHDGQQLPVEGAVVCLGFAELC
jgi:hypothetical protein